MRPLLILLLAANLLMFAGVQGWLDRVGGAGALPDQVHPDRLRVVPIDRLGDPPSPAPPPAPLPSSAPSPSSVPSPGLAPAKARSMEPFAPPSSAPSSAPIRRPAEEPLPAPRRSPSREVLPMPFAGGPAAAPLPS